MALHNEVGALGEALVREALATVGRVDKGRSDVRFEGVEIEVKTARPSRYNGVTWGYQFLLVKRDAFGRTDVRKAQVLVLVCLDFAGAPRAVLVLPVTAVGERKKVTVPLDLQGQWREYLGRWDVIAEEV